MLDAKLPKISVEDWNVASELMQLLEPFDRATLNLYASKYQLPAMYI